MCRSITNSALAETPAHGDTPTGALLLFLAPYRWYVLLAIVLLLASSIAVLTLPGVTRGLVDYGLVRDAGGIGDLYLIKFLIIIGFLAALSASRNYALSWLGDRAATDLRGELYRRLISVNAVGCDQQRVGEASARIGIDVTLLQSAVASQLMTAVQAGITICGSVALLVQTSWMLTAVLLGLTSALYVPVHTCGRRVKDLSLETQSHLAHSMSILSESLGAIRTVQLLVLQEEFTRAFKRTLEASFFSSVKRARAMTALATASTGLVFGSITIILWLGALYVPSPAMTGGQLTRFLLLSGIFGNAILQLANSWGQLQRSRAPAERVGSLLLSQPTRAGSLVLRSCGGIARGAIGFHNVTFYSPSRPALPAVLDFHGSISPGELTAIVGPSGAGKSTLLDLLLRFYEPSRGYIEIDGLPLSGIEPDDLRRQVGVVSQEPVLFRDTVRENIRYGCPRANDEDVRAVAAAIGIDKFLRALPKGYDTVVGERGEGLSGGQRQLIAIARALLKAPRILLLDEPTSALDAATEGLILDVLYRLRRDRTVVLIAHGPAPMLRANRIIVMNQGRSIAAGTHIELLASCPLYERLAAGHFVESAARPSGKL